MKNSRDIALIIMFAGLTFVFRFFIGRIVAMIQIPGFVYIVTIFFSLIQSVSFLMYRGRRWRLISQVLLSTLLYLMLINPTLRANEMAVLLNIFIVDLVFNSFYDSFEKKNKLLWLTIIFQIYYWITYSLLLLLFASALFFPFERFMQNWFIPVMSVMLPVMIIEAIIGSYLGYRIYRRVEKLA